MNADHSKLQHALAALRVASDWMERHAELLQTDADIDFMDDQVAVTIRLGEFKPGQPELAKVMELFKGSEAEVLDSCGLTYYTVRWKNNIGFDWSVYDRPAKSETKQETITL